MNLRNRVAYVCIAIPALVELGLGIATSARPRSCPTTRRRSGLAWSELESGVRALLLTLLNGYGSAHFAVGIALGALLAFPLRRGKAWARWAILAVGLPVLGVTAFLSARLAALTGSSVPWHGAVVLLLLFLAGVALFDPKAVARPVDVPDRPPPDSPHPGER